MGLWPGLSIPPLKEVCSPQPKREKNLGTFGSTECPLLPPCQSLLPLMLQAFAILSPEASAAGRSSLRAWQRSSLTGEPHKGACSGKNKAPTLETLVASLGAPRSLTTVRKGQPAHCLMNGGTSCPNVTRQCRPEWS